MPQAQESGKSSTNRVWPEDRFEISKYKEYELNLVSDSNNVNLHYVMQAMVLQSYLLICSFDFPLKSRQHSESRFNHCP